MRVSRWGDSLAVRLPRELVERMGLAEGDEVEVMAAGERALAVAKEGSAEEFRARLKALRRPAPPGYRWRREDAYHREADEPDHPDCEP